MNEQKKNINLSLPESTIVLIKDAGQKISKMFGLFIVDGHTHTHKEEAFHTSIKEQFLPISISYLLNDITPSFHNCPLHVRIFLFRILYSSNTYCVAGWTSTPSDNLKY